MNHNENNILYESDMDFDYDPTSHHDTTRKGSIYLEYDNAHIIWMKHWLTRIKTNDKGELWGILQSNLPIIHTGDDVDEPATQQDSPATYIMTVNKTQKNGIFLGSKSAMTWAIMYSIFIPNSAARLFPQYI